MALKVHSIVQDAHDFDRAVWRPTVHQEVTSAATAPCDVQRAKTGQDLFAGLGARNIGTIGKLANGLNERVAIDARLPHAKTLSGPSDDVREVDLGGGAETDAPSPLGHRKVYSAVLEMTLSERSSK
jgi:hypothetical protein